jgi:hypothetical protein
LYLSIAMRLKPLVVITVALLISILAVLNIRYGVLTRYNYFTARWDALHNNTRLLTYGKAFTTAKQQHKIASNMGFDVVGIGGCMISHASVNGADQYNRVMTKVLNHRLGLKWKAIFDKRVDSLFRIDSTPLIYKAVLSDPFTKRYFSAQRRPLKKEDLYVKVVDTTDTDSLHPNAWLCGKTFRGLAVYGYFRVNPYTLSVAHILY